MGVDNPTNHTRAPYCIEPPPPGSAAPPLASGTQPRFGNVRARVTRDPPAWTWRRAEGEGGVGACSRTTTTLKIKSNMIDLTTTKPSGIPYIGAERLHHHPREAASTNVNTTANKYRGERFLLSLLLSCFTSHLNVPRDRYSSRGPNTDNRGSPERERRWRRKSTGECGHGDDKEGQKAAAV